MPGTFLKDSEVLAKSAEVQGKCTKRPADNGCMRASWLLGGAEYGGLTPLKQTGPPLLCQRCSKQCLLTQVEMALPWPLSAVKGSLSSSTKRGRPMWEDPNSFRTCADLIYLVPVSHNHQGMQNLHALRLQRRTSSGTSPEWVLQGSTTSIIFLAIENKIRTLTCQCRQNHPLAIMVFKKHFPIFY